MDKLFQSYLDSLAIKYQAEPDLHEEISTKIRQRLASFMIAPGEYLHLEKAIRSHVEETYRRLLTTKRNFREAKKLLKESHQITQENAEKLLQIKSSVNSLKALLEEHKADWGVLMVKKKGQPKSSEPLLEQQGESAESPGDVPSPLPFGYGHN